MLRKQAIAAGILSLLAGALLAPPLAAQRLQGPEVTVNSTPGVFPSLSQVARATNGDFVVVWTGYGSSGAKRIWMRRVSAAGKPKGRESQVVAPFAAGGQQDNPRIAVAPGGNFMVVWDLGDQYFHNASFGRCFAASGKALGPPFPLNPDNQDPIDLHPAVAAAPDGSFVATWASGSNESDQGFDLLARRFAANGRPLGPAFKLVEPAAYFQNYPRVTVSRNGDLLFAWMSDMASPRPSNYRLLVRRFDAEGHPLGDPVQAVPDSLVDAYQYNMAVAEDGEILFVWVGFYSRSGLLGQRCAADGTPIGEPITIHSADNVDPIGPPGVTATPGGGWFVVWSTESGPSQRVVGNALASDGTPQGDDVKIGAAQLVYFPAIAIGRNGAGSVIWTTATLQPEQSKLIFRRLVF